MKPLVVPFSGRCWAAIDANVCAMGRDPEGALRAYHNHYHEKPEERRQQFRCPCCGMWLWCWKHQWQNRGSEIFYCEGCSVGRFGKGRRQCEYCQEYPQGQRWNDPKPALPVFGFAVCVR